MFLHAARRWLVVVLGLTSVLTLFDWWVHAEMSREAPWGWETMARVLALDLPATLALVAPLAMVYPGLLIRWSTAVRDASRVLLAVLGLGAIVAVGSFVLTDQVGVHANREVVLVTQRALAAPDQPFTPPEPSPQELSFAALGAQLEAKSLAKAPESEITYLATQRQFKLALPVLAFVNACLGLVLGAWLVGRRWMIAPVGLALGLILNGLAYVLMMVGMGAPSLLGFVGSGAWLSVVGLAGLALLALAPALLRWRLSAPDRPGVASVQG